MLRFREANLEDVELYFNWVNDSDVREQSFNSEDVNFETHKNWFILKLQDKTCTMLVFQDESNENIGQVRIQKESSNYALIGISVSKQYRGKGLAKDMLRNATNYFLNLNPEFIINAYIKETNLYSKYAFENAGFEFKEMVVYHKHNSFYYTKEICK